MSYFPPPPPPPHHPTPHHATSHHPPHAQPQAAVDSPPPYLERVDCALPPGYSHSWDEVLRKAFFPTLFKDKPESFENYLKDALLNEPGWFQCMKAEIHKYHNPSGLLWPNTVHLPDPGDDVKHWSISFLRYHILHNDRLETSNFACEIFLEIIFVLLTPEPKTWIGGCEALESLTGWTEKAVKRWFERRVNADCNQLESDPYTQTVDYRYVSGSVKVRVKICTAALHCIRDSAQGTQWDLGVFNFCLNYLLKGMAEAQVAKRRRFVPHRSVISRLLPIQSPHFHGIYVGPLSRRFETQWTLNPLLDLKAIQTWNYPLGRITHFPEPDSCLIPKDHSYRVFLFSSESKATQYLERWHQGRIDSRSRYLHVTVERYDVARH